MDGYPVLEPLKAWRRPRYRVVFARTFPDHLAIRPGRRLTSHWYQLHYAVSHHVPRGEWFLIAPSWLVVPPKYIPQIIELFQLSLDESAPVEVRRLLDPPKEN